MAGTGEWRWPKVWTEHLCGLPLPSLSLPPLFPAPIFPFPSHQVHPTPPTFPTSFLLSFLCPPDSLDLFPISFSVSLTPAPPISVPLYPFLSLFMCVFLCIYLFLYFEMRSTGYDKRSCAAGPIHFKVNPLQNFLLLRSQSTRGDKRQLNSGMDLKGS